MPIHPNFHDQPETSRSPGSKSFPVSARADASGSVATSSAMEPRGSGGFGRSASDSTTTSLAEAAGSSKVSLERRLAFDRAAFGRFAKSGAAFRFGLPCARSGGGAAFRFGLPSARSGAARRRRPARAAAAAASRPRSADDAPAAGDAPAVGAAFDDGFGTEEVGGGRKRPGEAFGGVRGAGKPIPLARPSPEGPACLLLAPTLDEGAGMALLAGAGSSPE